MTALLAELRGAAVIAGGALALLAAAQAWRRWGGAPPEYTRKLVHVGGGLVCVFLPFLVASVWTVLALTGGLCALFLWGKLTGRLAALHAVNRPSRGAEYYPLAIFVLVLVTRGEPWLYVACVLTLAAADAAAALIGGRYGRLRFEVEDERKSVEGSFTFLVVAFLCLHLPMLLMTDLPRGRCVLVALLAAMLLTGFEIIALRGFDNLVVPFAACILLTKLTAKPTAEVAFQAGSLAVLTVVTAALAWRTATFNTGGAIVLVLFGYGAWSLGSVLWGLPPLFGLAAYTAMAWRYPPRAGERPAKVRTVTMVVLPLFLVLAAANIRNSYDVTLGPYLAAVGLTTGFVLWQRRLGYCALSGWRRRAHATALGAAGWVVAVPLAWVLHVVYAPGGLRAAPVVRMLVLTAAVCLPLAWVDEWARERAAARGAVGAWTATRFVLTLVAATLTALAQAVLSPL